jgi:predicted short-subunit dehydrogenase-like oxidoreductase (DUF2520 family)
MPTLNLIGCGRVGKALARAWHTQGTLSVQDILTTSPQSARDAVQWLGSGTACGRLASMRAADVWMLAVPDRTIAATAAEMAATFAHLPPQTVFHCSGALSTQALAPLAALGWSVASAHCILSFADPLRVQSQLPGTPCALEGDAAALSALKPLFAAIGLSYFELPADQKLLYHAAAVFATNFLPVLQTVAEQLWQDSGVPADLMPRLRASLLQNAVDNLLALGPQAALTGPAARGDQALVAQQAAALAQWDGVSAQAYQALSELAGRLARTAQIKTTDTPNA